MILQYSCFCHVFGKRGISLGNFASWIRIGILQAAPDSIVLPSCGSGSSLTKTTGNHAKYLSTHRKLAPSFYVKVVLHMKHNLYLTVSIINGKKICKKLLMEIILMLKTKYFPTEYLRKLNQTALLEKQSKFPRYNMNVEENLILHELFRVISRFPCFISCYIA